MELDAIERHLDLQLKELVRRQANPEYIVTFGSYKALFDTCIALKQAEALQSIAKSLKEEKPS